MSSARRTVSARRLLTAPLAASIAVVVLLAISFVEAPQGASASHAGGADFFLIDMDPSGNTNTSFGTIESCARINPNGVQDADEDGVDLLDIDVLAGEVPGYIDHPPLGQGPEDGGGIHAFQFALLYQGGPFIVVDNDPNYLLASLPGSSIFDASDPLPDSDGEYYVAAVDLGDTRPFGNGVLSRITLAPSGAAAQGVHPLTLTKAAHVDPRNDPYLPDNEIPSPGFSMPLTVTQRAHLAVDVPCPPQTDLKVTSVTLDVPEEVPIGVPFDVSVEAVVHNNGPVTPVNADVEFVLPILAPCVSPSATFVTIPVEDIVIHSSVSASLGPFTLSVTCSDSPTGDYPFRAFLEIAADDFGARDVNLENDFLTSTVTVAIGDSDNVPAAIDNCPNDTNPSQADGDGDGAGDACDACPGTLASAAVDALGCSLLQVDSDGDGVCNEDAPSQGPSPGCVRSLAVGGIAGIVDTSTSDNSAAESTGGLAYVAALAVVIGATLIAAGWYARRRRQNRRM